MTTPITPLADGPHEGQSSADFRAAANVLLSGALQTMVDELNVVALAMTQVALSDTSTTSNSVTTGALTFTVTAGKSFLPGMFLIIADAAAPTTNYIFAQVDSYSATTLTVTGLTATGSGTKTSWVITFANPIVELTGYSEVVVSGANGYGSTNTKIRRYTTTQVSTGSGITYADSAANGASFTINEAGIYTVSFVEQNTGASNFGVSVNSSQLTTNIESITAANRLTMTYLSTNAVPFNGSVTRYFAVNDVIRPHTNGGTSSAAVQQFSVTKVQGF